jgi:hypothetical protein
VAEEPEAELVEEAPVSEFGSLEPVEVAVSSKADSGYGDDLDLPDFFR